MNRLLAKSDKLEADIAKLERLGASLNTEALQEEREDLARMKQLYNDLRAVENDADYQTLAELFFKNFEWIKLLVKKERQRYALHELIEAQQQQLSEKEGDIPAAALFWLKKDIERDQDILTEDNVLRDVLEVIDGTDVQPSDTLLEEQKNNRDERDLPLRLALDTLHRHYDTELLGFEASLEQGWKNQERREALLKKMEIIPLKSHKALFSSLVKMSEDVQNRLATVSFAYKPRLETFENGFHDLLGRALGAETEEQFDRLSAESKILFSDFVRVGSEVLESDLSSQLKAAAESGARIERLRELKKPGSPFEEKRELKIQV